MGSDRCSLPHRLIARPEFGPFVLLVIELFVFWAINHDVLSPGNISNTLAFTVELGLIALAMTLLMTSGEFDLSVGSLFGFSPVLMWTLTNSGVMPLELPLLVALAVAAVIGFVNGWFVTRLKIPSFLVTLGMLLVVRGTVLTQSKVGNWIQAAGGNPGATRARGVKVERTEIALFMLSATLAAFACIIRSIRASAANPNSGTGYGLEAIAMVVIGSTALTGRRGTIIGTVLGIFVLRVMRNGIVLVGVPGLAYNIFIGAIIWG